MKRFCDVFAQFVHGTLNYSLISLNFTTVSVIAPSQNRAVFNSTDPLGVRLPVFFFALSSWTGPAQRIVFLGGSSGQYEFVGQHIQLNITATCPHGTFINISSTLLNNVTTLYRFLVPLASSAQLCSKCSAGSSSASLDTLSFCSNCTAGTFADSNNTKCSPCPDGMWSRAGTQAACRECSSSAATTIGKDHCAAFLFLHPPPPTVVSGAWNKVPPVVMVDVFNSAVIQRSGTIFIQLQCQLPRCQTDLNSEFNLITSSLSLVNGSSAAADIFLLESSQIKVGTGFVWRIYTLQEPSTLATSNINSFQSLFSVMFLGTAASIGAVSPTQVASVGGTALTVTSTWKLLPRILNEFVNDSAFCVFDFIGSAVLSNTTNSTFPQGASQNFTRQERVLAIDASETIKICSTPAILEFTYANLSIVMQDGRVSPTPFALKSVCHKNFYISNSKCLPCPASVTGRSSNDLINAESVELCVCSIGSYGTFGEFCRFCPRPSSYRGTPFICNTSNLRYPEVSPGFWVDYSLLSQCDAVSATCAAVTTCAFGARACPGGGEKMCTQSDEECYEGNGCSNCCPMYYNENNACFKCPDSSQSIALLAVVGAVCFILAVLMSSISSPSFTQSSQLIRIYFFGHYESYLTLQLNTS